MGSNVKDSKHLFYGLYRIFTYVLAVLLYITLGICWGIAIGLKKLLTKVGALVFIATMAVSCSTYRGPVAYYKLYECEDQQTVDGKRTKVFTFYKDEIQISDIQMQCKMKKKPKKDVQ